MGFLRGLGRWAGMGLWLVVLAPALALVPAAVLDRGPAGEVRASVFPLALGALDPFVWDCLRNSLAVAVAVSAGSLALGVHLARLVVLRRFWGRIPLAALAIAPAVVPPLIGALGMRALFGARLEAEHGRWLGWFCWAWAALASGVPLVALASASALARVGPGWVDAARLAGASRFRVWRRLVWPVVRPDAARAAATVFTLTLLEPGAPLLLGLRRTLAFQVVESVLAPDPLPRAAVLALSALGLAAAGRVLIRWWGGPPVPLAPEGPSPRAESAPWPHATVSLLALGLAAVLAWLPVLVVVVSALAPARGGSSASTAPTLRWFADPGSRRAIANSLGLGLAVVAIDLVLARAVVACAGPRRRLFRILATWPEVVPPLALGVGALSVPWLLRLWAETSRTSGHALGPMVRGLGALAAGLDPDRTPGVLLVVAVSATCLPLLAKAVASGKGRDRRDLFDAALSLGATPRSARRASTSGWFGVSPGALLLTIALAATNLAPALVLEPSAASRTAAPGILVLADEPGDGLAIANRLAACAVVVNVVALAIAAGGRDRSLGEWCS